MFFNKMSKSKKDTLNIYIISIISYEFFLTPRQSFIILQLQHSNSFTTTLPCPHPHIPGTDSPCSFEPLKYKKSLKGL